MDLTEAMTIVDVAIDEVTVEGLDELDRLALRDALEGHLARLIEERGIPSAWLASGARAELGAELDWDGRGGTNGLSAALADRIYRGFAP